jgi:hypothetical protein
MVFQVEWKLHFELIVKIGVFALKTDCGHVCFFVLRDSFLNGVAPKFLYSSEWIGSLLFEINKKHNEIYDNKENREI